MSRERDGGGRKVRKSHYVRSVARFSTLREVYQSLCTHPMLAIKGRVGAKTLRDVLFFSGALTKLLLDAMRDGAEIHLRWPDRYVEVVDINLAFGEDDDGPSATEGRDAPLEERSGECPAV